MAAIQNSPLIALRLPVAAALWAETLRDSSRGLASEVWQAFSLFSLLAIIVRLLYGSGAISEGALTIGLLCALLGFVPWAVLQLDPKGLSELGSYDKDQH